MADFLDAKIAGHLKEIKEILEKPKDLGIVHHGFVRVTNTVVINKDQIIRVTAHSDWFEITTIFERFAVDKELAHPDFFNLLVQIGMDEKELTT